MLRRKERDRAKVAERQVEHLKETIAAKDTQIAGFMEKVSDSAVLLQREQTEHEQTQKALQAAQATVKELDAEVQALRLQLNDHKKSTAVIQQKMSSLEKLTTEFEALAGETQASEAALEAWHDALEARRAKTLKILEAVELSALAVISQLAKEGVEAQAVHELSQQVLSPASGHKGLKFRVHSLTLNTA